MPSLASARCMRPNHNKANYPSIVSIFITMVSILYLLVKADKSSFKIGITDNLESRHDRLRLFWGNFDLPSSCTVSGTQQDIAGLEKTLHYLLEKWRIKPSLKLDGHSEWFSIDCFDTSLELISSIALIKGYNSDNLIKKGIDLAKKKPNSKKEKIRSEKLISDFEELKKHWSSFEDATLVFKEKPTLDLWSWTINLARCEVSPFDLLSFHTKNGGFNLALNYSYSEQNPYIVDISIPKSCLLGMLNYEELKPVHEFISEMLPRLASINRVNF